MREQKRILQNGLKLLAITFLVSCGNPANPPPPKFTGENLAAEKPKPAPPKPPAAPQEPKTSLDELRTGQSAAASPLKDIGFNFDSAALSEDARSMLRTNADWLKGNATARVQIEGHCDSRGSIEYNLSLGERRAQAVRSYMTSLGVGANRLSIISYGKEKPLANGDSESDHARNRRANFVPIVQ